MADITRQEVVVVDKVWENDFGDLLFTDKGGTERKIGTKRKSYFQVIQPGVAVQLNYAQAYGKEYIYNAILVTGKLPPSVTPEPPPRQTDEPKPPRPIPSIRENMEWKAEQIERSLWWKEIGGLICAGKLEEVFGEKGAPLIQRAYKLQAILSLGITDKKEGA